MHLGAAAEALPAELERDGLEKSSHSVLAESLLSIEVDAAAARPP